MITAASLINGKLDIFMLGLLSDKASVAIYGLATQMAGLVLMGQTLVNTIVGPRIARQHALGNKPEMAELVRHAGRLSSFMALASVPVILLLGEGVITTLVGGDYVGAAEVAIIVGTGYLFSAAMGPVALVLNMTGHRIANSQGHRCFCPAQCLAQRLPDPLLRAVRRSFGDGNFHRRSTIPPTDVHGKKIASPDCRLPMVLDDDVGKKRKTGSP